MPVTIVVVQKRGEMVFVQLHHGKHGIFGIPQNRLARLVLVVGDHEMCQLFISTYPSI